MLLFGQSLPVELSTVEGIGVHCNTGGCYADKTTSEELCWLITVRLSEPSRVVETRGEESKRVAIEVGKQKDKIN